jgi:hypothetical protein
MTTTQATVERLFHKIQPLAQFHLVKQAYEFAKKARAHRDPYANAYDDYAVFATQAYHDLYTETGVALLLAEEVHCTHAVPLALAFLYDELKGATSTVEEIESTFGAEIAHHLTRLTPPFKQTYLYHPQSPFYSDLRQADRNVRLVYSAHELYLYRFTMKQEYRQGYPPYLREKLEYGVLPIARITDEFLTAELTGILETLQGPPPKIPCLP